MIEWLADTLVMTGALMLVVLLVRRPVGRWFGPHAAYALWALPMIRLVLPPLVLPGEPVSHTRILTLNAPIEAMPAGSTSPIPILVQEPGVFVQVPWAALLVTIWLVGALVFLLWRAVAYKAMTRDLLDGARRIGTSGRVRIIESPAVSVPVAFGVFDKFVALPLGFLAAADSDLSDYAIAHEIEHHAGSDLVANIAVQPLFALHWFNPLAWAAWRALRSDQEAACDGRVMRGRGREERARYGNLIASFAAGPKLTLAAPMAGPLCGDKPIIHRLKALAQGDVAMERKVLARSLFAASVIAVPLTATVSYAAIEEPQLSELPATPATPIAEGPSPVQAADLSPIPEMPKGSTRAEVRKVITREVEDETSDAERLGVQAEARARDAVARAPVVEESTSPDGNVQTIRIVRKVKGGGSDEVREIAIDSTCPAGSRKASADATGGGSTVSVQICTGEPRQIAAALKDVRASIAADGKLDRSVRAEILSELDAEIAEAARD